MAAPPWGSLGVGQPLLSPSLPPQSKRVRRKKKLRAPAAPALPSAAELEQLWEGLAPQLQACLEVPGKGPAPRGVLGVLAGHRVTLSCPRARCPSPRTWCPSTPPRRRRWRSSARRLCCGSRSACGIPACPTPCGCSARPGTGTAMPIPCPGRGSAVPACPRCPQGGLAQRGRVRSRGRGAARGDAAAAGDPRRSPAQ